jgi:hypothetical protein
MFVIFFTLYFGLQILIIRNNHESCVSMDCNRRVFQISVEL